jgi:hypothetical protein
MTILIALHDSWAGHPGLTEILAMVKALEKPAPAMSPASPENGSPSRGQTTQPAAPPSTPSSVPTTPTTGKELYRYAADNELLRFFGRLGKAWNLPGRIVDWEPIDVSAA